MFLEITLPSSTLLFINVDVEAQRGDMVYLTTAPEQIGSQASTRPVAPYSLSNVLSTVNVFLALM